MDLRQTGEHLPILLQFLFGISDERIDRQLVAGSLKDLHISCGQPPGPIVLLPPQVRLPPLRRGQNSHGLTVLGYRAPGNTDRLIAEEPGQILIAVWFHRVLGRDEAPDLFPHALRSHILPIILPKTALKKLFKFIEALGCMDVFVGSCPADRGLMHFYILSHIPKDHRL